MDLSWNLINVPLWDRARWLGVMYVNQLDAPDDSFLPIMGLIFQNHIAGREIFKEWNERFHGEDKDGLLRVSIIEGHIKGQDPGYSVHITSDYGVAERLFGRPSDSDLALIVSRVHRMNPDRNSPNLSRFKAALPAAGGRYRLAPVWIEGGQPKISSEHALVKYGPVFRNALDVRRNDDIDGPVLRRPR